MGMDSRKVNRSRSEEDAGTAWLLEKQKFNRAYCQPFVTVRDGRHLKLPVATHPCRSSAILYNGARESPVIVDRTSRQLGE